MGWNFVDKYVNRQGKEGAYTGRNIDKGAGGQTGSS